MDDFFYRDTDGLTKRNDSSSINTPTTYHSADTTQEEPKCGFDFFNLHKPSAPSAQAERRAARRAQKIQGLSGLPKKWSSASALSSSTSRRDRYAGMNDDSPLLLSNGFADFPPPPPPSSPKPVHSPRLSINGRIGLKSPLLATMKFVPSPPKSPAVRSAGHSPSSRRKQVNESMTGALGDLPPAPTMPVGRPMTPGLPSRKTLMKSDNYQRMSNSMSNLKLHSFDNDNNNNTPVASHFKHKSGMGGHDIFELDPFADSHSIGEVNDFSTGDEDDDDFFSGNNKSADSHSSTWEQFIAKNKKKGKKHDRVKSDVDEMRRSMHEQEKDMERELQKKDDIIRMLTEQLEVGKGSFHKSKADGQDSDEKKSKPKDKLKSKSDHGKSKKSSSKVEKQRDADSLSGKRTKQKRRGSAGVLEGAKGEKPKRRGSTGVLDGRKSPRREKRSGGSKKEKEKEAATKDTLAVLLGVAQGLSIEGSDSPRSIGRTKRVESGTSVPSLKSTTSTRSRKSSSDAKSESKEKKKKAKQKKSKAVDE